MTPRLTDHSDRPAFRQRPSLRLRAALGLLIPVAAATLSACGGTAPRLTHENLNSVLWMQTTGEHSAACMTVYRDAQALLDKAIADPGWTAALEQTGDASTLATAVMLDVDETALDNMAYQARLTKTNHAWSLESWNAWCAEEACTAVPGAADFCRAAVEKGATVLFVTNRDAALNEATMRNLSKAGFPNDPRRVQVIGKTDDSDKGPRRAELAKRYRILFLVGDQLGDFFSVPKGSTPEDRKALAERYADRWGKTWFALPNPTYGDWERAMVDSKKTDAENLKSKYARLRP